MISSVRQAKGVLTADHQKGWGAKRVLEGAGAMHMNACNMHHELGNPPPPPPPLPILCGYIAG